MPVSASLLEPSVQFTQTSHPSHTMSTTDNKPDPHSNSNISPKSHQNTSSSSLSNQSSSHNTNSSTTRGSSQTQNTSYIAASNSGTSTTTAASWKHFQQQTNASNTIRSFRRKGALISTFFIVPFIGYISYRYYQDIWLKQHYKAVGSSSSGDGSSSSLAAASSILYQKCFGNAERERAALEDFLSLHPSATPSSPQQESPASTKEQLVNSPPSQQNPLLFDCLYHVKKFFGREISSWKELHVLLRYIGSFRSAGAMSAEKQAFPILQAFLESRDESTNDSSSFLTREDKFKTINFIRRLVLESDRHLQEDRLHLVVSASRGSDAPLDTATETTAASSPSSHQNRLDLNKLEVACLLAKCFFGLYSQRSDFETYYDLKYKFMPSANMTQLFSEGHHPSEELHRLKQEKLKFIFQYFDTLRRRVEHSDGELESINYRLPQEDQRNMTSSLLHYLHVAVTPWNWKSSQNTYKSNQHCANISIYRESIDSNTTNVKEILNQSSGDASSNALSKISSIVENSSIEEDSTALQADFSNRYIGGGVYTEGCTQEEIYFLLHPELLVTRLLCPVLSWNESITIQGAERFSTHRGYASSLTFGGRYIDRSFSRTPQGIVKSSNTMMAFDPLKYTFQRVANQWKKPCIDREILKAYVAFKENTLSKEFDTISTGTWGSGSFHGDAELKFLIQWIAASLAGRKMIYHSFYYPSLKDKIENFVSFAESNQITAQALYDALMELSQEFGVEDAGSLPEKVRMHQRYPESLSEVREILKRTHHGRQQEAV